MIGIVLSAVGICTEFGSEMRVSTAHEKQPFLIRNTDATEKESSDSYIAEGLLADGRFNFCGRSIKSRATATTAAAETRYSISNDQSQSKSQEATTAKACNQVTIRDA